MKKLFLAGLLGFVGSAYAVDFNGVKVDCGENASEKWVGEELVLTFTGESTLQIDGYVMARILVVGGGGSGSTGYNGTGTSVEYMGNGGAGGEAIEVDRHYLAAGSYAVKVGDGGAVVSAGNSKARTAGKPGMQSSFAGIVAEGGAGGVTQTGSQNGTGSNTVMGWGSNLISDISGSSVIYSVGGAKSTNAKSSGAKGANTGSGGQGGGGKGCKSGAGGKGVVIVRINAATLHPPVTASFSRYVQYVGGVAVSPFETVPDWAASITGTTNSAERGFFKFTVDLKEGYVWSDTFGREQRTFDWAVVDDISKGDSYLEVKKTVNPDPSNPSNATISIIGHVPPEKVAVNVLFMGTMCYAHSLRPKTIQSAINSIAQHASVDWYLYHSKGNVNKVGVLRDYDTNVASTIPDTMMHTNLCGTVAKGGEIDDNFVRNELDRQMQSNNHQALNSFMELLYEISQDAARSKKYDYIVLEFDGSRVANDYTTYAHEAEVAAFLKPYYDAGKVVWLVDNCAAGEFEPFGPGGGSGRKNKYYTPCTYFHNGASTVLETDALYSGLVALTDPAKYLSASGKTRAKLATASFSWLPSEGYRKTTSSGEMVKTSKTIYANTRCERQVPYDDPDGLSDYLRGVIQEKPYDLRFEDKVVDEGLEITAAHLSTSGVSRAANESGWADISGQPNVTIDIDNAAHTVNAAVLGMCSETWAKLDIAVRDTGTFFADAEPVYNEEADRWEVEKNPNDGNAKVKKYDDGVETAVAEGDSPTLNNWIYPSYLIVGLVTNGTLKIDGVETNAALKAQGADCEVTYGPDPDYELDYISVDGVRLSPEESAEVLTAYEFTGIVTNHEIVVVYKPGIKPIGIVVEPVEVYYDKNPQNISFTVTNANGEVITPDPEKTKVYYKGPDDADWVPAEEFAGLSNVTKAAGSTSSNGVVTVEVKVLIDGYQEAESSSTVRVMPRVVAEQAGSAEKPYDGLPLANSDHTPDPQAATNYAYEIYHEVKYPEIYDGPPRDDWADAIGFADGDAFDVVPMSGSQTEVGSSPNVVNVNSVTFTEGTQKDNYAISFSQGTLTVVEATMGIEAFLVEKFYDAEETNVTWIVTNATGAVISDATISLREKGTTEWIPVADFALYVDTTNVTVEIKAEKSGFSPVTAEATVLVKPRPVTLIAGSDSKTYDGTPLTCDDFEVKNDDTTAAVPGYGFVDGEGIESVTMTPESTITEPGTKANEIASEIAKEGTKLERNYVVSTEPGELTVTDAAMGIEAFPVEKFYDAEETNVTWIVTNATGAVITDATISLREKGTTEWIPAADFVQYVDTTNVIVEVKAEKSGFSPVTAEATVLVKPRPVTLIAGSDSKTYDGTPLTCDDFEVKDDDTTAATPGYGFVKEEGVESVTMTPESTITDPGSQPNVIATETAKEGTKLERNYVVSTEPGTLTVTDATMGIEAFPVEKFYDAEETNIAWIVTNSTGAVITDATISLREKGTTEWIPVANFVQYVDTTNVTVEVKAEKSGFSPVTAEATVLVKPRPVTLIAGSAEKTYDGTPLTNWTFTVKEDAAPEYGFVPGEGIESVTMTPESTITEPGTKANEIASEIAKEGTKLERNYVVSTEPGELTVTNAAMGIEAFPVEKFYDAEEANIAWIVTNATGAVISDATISLREKGTDEWIPAADFPRYVDTTNVIVQVKAEKTGYTSVETEAELLIKPRLVTLIAGSDSKTYDGTPLTCDDFEVKDDDTTAAVPGYGFVKDEGVESVTMTPDSTITDPGSQPNVIATETAKEGTKLERNYVVSTEPGTLTVTDATMGIEAFPVEKFYDAEETNVTWIVTNASGAVISDATISLRVKGTDAWIPAADFIQYVDTTNVTVEVKAEKSGFSPVTAEATVLVKPRPVTLIAGSAEKTYDGTPLTNWTFTVKEDAAPEYGFVPGEGIESVTMTPESTITEPGTKVNEIASEIAKEGTKLERNYVVSTEPGELKINEATMGIEAFPVEKFYDAEETNVTWIVTNTAGAVISDVTISLREKGTDAWIPAADFPRYVDTTNVTVEVKAEKTGYTSVETEAELLVKPRPVTLIAGSAEKTYDGEPLTNWTFTVKRDASTEAIPGYDFVDGEGVASVTMTPESTITEPGTKVNEIATEVAIEGTKLDRNYIVSTEPGELKINEATMGIEAFPVEKFYDAEETNVTWIVTNTAGAVISDVTISLREKGTDAWIPAADFPRYVDTTNVIVQVKAEKTGYTSVETEAELLIKPRPVTLIAGSSEKTYDGLPLTNWTFTVKRDASTEAIPGYDFVADEGVESVAMTPESTITDPGTKVNEIASEIAKEGTKLERNYIVSTEPGELKINEAKMGIEAFSVEKFYDAEETNVTWIVTNSTGAVISDATISLREKGTDPWIPAADFPRYVDTTNVIVQVKAEKTGYTSVGTEATLLVKPRPVTLVAASESKYYDGKPLTNWNFTVKVVTSTDGYGFVKNEGVARVEMTPESTITDFGSVPNVIATVVAKPGTDLERNYVVSTEPGELKVVKHCNCDDESDDPCSLRQASSRVVYNWKFNGKTTKGYRMSQSVSPCFAPVSKYVRIPAAYVLSGMTYICDNCCCTSQYLGDEVSVFTQRKPIASSVASQNLTMTVFDIVGRKGIQVEVVGELEYKPDNGATVYHLVFSGFGTWDAKNQRISQVSGKFAGTASGVYYSEGNCETEVSVPAWSVCDLLPDYDASSVVFGSWSMRYDAAATKKMSR